MRPKLIANPLTRRITRVPSPTFYHSGSRDSSGRLLFMCEVKSHPSSSPPTLFEWRSHRTTSHDCDAQHFNSPKTGMGVRVNIRYRAALLQTEIIPFVIHLINTTGLWVYVLQYSQNHTTSLLIQAASFPPRQFLLVVTFTRKRLRFLL